MLADSARPAFRRVLFIDGFQPRGAAGLHREYRQAAQARSALGDVHIEVGHRARLSALSDVWTVDWHAGVQPVRTCFEVLRWDDVVRRHWPRAGRGMTALLWRDAWRVWRMGLGSGVFGRIRKLSFANWAMAVFPGAVAVAGAAWLAGAAGLVSGMLFAAGKSAALAWAAGGLAWVLLGAYGLRTLWPHVPSALWLLRLIGFTLAQARDELPDLENRIAAMAERTAHLWQGGDAPQAPPAEVLVVGYSTGAILAPLVVAQAQQLLAARRGGLRAPLAILTLGHCTPMLSLMPEAAAFRAALSAVAGDADVAWVDYSAAPDVAACAGVPPWWNAQALGLKRSLSPRFHRVLPPADYAALRRDLQALHRQYLKGPAQSLQAGDYDYLSLTAGSTTLRARFAAESLHPT